MKANTCKCYSKFWNCYKIMTLYYNIYGTHIICLASISVTLINMWNSITYYAYIAHVLFCSIHRSKSFWLRILLKRQKEIEYIFFPVLFFVLWNAFMYFTYQFITLEKQYDFFKKMFHNCYSFSFITIKHNSIILRIEFQEQIISWSYLMNYASNARINS